MDIKLQEVILLKVWEELAIRENNYFFDVKGDDVYLAVDLVSGAFENIYDTAVIVSGDEDFFPAIKKIQKLGKKITNAYFKSSSSASLKKICNNSILINNFIKELKE